MANKEKSNIEAQLRGELDPKTLKRLTYMRNRNRELYRKSKKK